MGMGMGMGDSTLSGQSFFVNMAQGICSSTTNGPCTVFGGNVSVEFANGTKATPSNGMSSSFNIKCVPYNVSNYRPQAFTYTIYSPQILTEHCHISSALATTLINQDLA